jgi:hypothetical protein
MTMRGSGREAAIRDAIDRHGADLASWRDRGLANETRAAVLADRQLRAYFDDGLTLARGLDDARTALDAEIAASGAVARVSAALSARLPLPQRRHGWVAVAATLVLAAGLGSAFDLAFLQSPDAGSFNVVVLDPLVFDPSDTVAQ